MEGESRKEKGRGKERQRKMRNDFQASFISLTTFQICFFFPNCQIEWSVPPSIACCPKTCQICLHARYP